MSDSCANSTAINTTTFKRGGKFPRPTLWLFGDQDPFYSLSHSKANFEAFLAAGGKGRFESYWMSGRNSGHSVIFHPRLWSEPVTQYLDALRQTHDSHMHRVPRHGQDRGLTMPVK